MYVGAGGLALNIISLILFAIQTMQENNEKKANGGSEKKEMNMNIYGVFLNALGDSLGSVAVIISALLIKYAPPYGDKEARWKVYVDPTLSLLIATIITASTIPLLKKSSMILLQSVPINCNVDELRKLVQSVRGVVDVHHFHIWSLNSDKLVASAHGGFFLGIFMENIE